MHCTWFFLAVTEILFFSFLFRTLHIVDFALWHFILLQPLTCRGHLVFPDRCDRDERALRRQAHATHNAGTTVTGKCDSTTPLDFDDHADYMPSHLCHQAPWNNALYSHSHLYTILRSSNVNKTCNDYIIKYEKYLIRKISNPSVRVHCFRMLARLNSFLERIKNYNYL